MADECQVLMGTVGFTGDMKGSSPVPDPRATARRRSFCRTTTVRSSTRMLLQWGIAIPAPWWGGRPVPSSPGHHGLSFSEFLFAG
jgi:hypothetical protein